MPAAGAAPSGRIVFVREVGQQAELFSIRPDGSGLTRLTHEPAYDSAPVWSPDGRRIASFGTGGVVIRTRDGFGFVDVGSGRRARIPGTAGSAGPSWSRAATIAFVRGRGVFVVRPDSGQRLIVARSDRPRSAKLLTRGASPDWS
jgi:Tol biopolymer transport system component